MIPIDDFQLIESAQNTALRTHVPGLHFEAGAAAQFIDDVIVSSARFASASASLGLPPNRAITILAIASPQGHSADEAAIAMISCTLAIDRQSVGDTPIGSRDRCRQGIKEVAQTSNRDLPVFRSTLGRPPNRPLFQLLRHLLDPPDLGRTPKPRRLRDEPIEIRASSDGSRASSFEGHTNGVYN